MARRVRATPPDAAAFQVPGAEGGAVVRRQLHLLRKVGREQRGRVQADRVLPAGHPAQGDPICSARRTGTQPVKKHLVIATYQPTLGRSCSQTC